MLKRFILFLIIFFMLTGQAFAMGYAYPENWGAKADSNGTVGSGTDNYSAIQDAINSLVSGGVVILGPGTYRISDTLVISKSNVSIIGAGDEITCIALDDNSGTESNLEIGNGGFPKVNNCTVEGILFRRCQSATAGAAISLNYAGVVNISKCRVYGNNNIFQGISIRRGMIVNIVDTKISNVVQIGIFAQGTGTGDNETIDVTIRGCRISYTGDAGISTWNYVGGFNVYDSIIYHTAESIVFNANSPSQGLSSFKVSNTDIDTASKVGMYINNVSDLSLSPGWVSNNGTGIDLRNVTGATISSSQFYGVTGRNNIQLGAGGSNTSDIVISGNLMRQGANGVVLGRSVNGIVVSGNRISSMTSNGLYASAGADDLTIIGNSFNGNGNAINTSGATNVVKSPNNIN